MKNSYTVFPVIVLTNVHTKQTKSHKKKPSIGITEFVLLLSVINLHEQSFTLVCHIVETISTDLIYITWTSKEKDQNEGQQTDIII